MRWHGWRWLSCRNGGVAADMGAAGNLTSILALLLFIRLAALIHCRCCHVLYDDWLRFNCVVLWSNHVDAIGKTKGPGGFFRSRSCTLPRTTLIMIINSAREVLAVCTGDNFGIAHRFGTSSFQ